MEFIQLWGYQDTTWKASGAHQLKVWLDNGHTWIWTTTFQWYDLGNYSLSLHFLIYNMGIILVYLL